MVRNSQGKIQRKNIESKKEQVKCRERINISKFKDPDTANAYREQIAGQIRTENVVEEEDINQLWMKI